uniref:Ribosomal protein S11 n=1 Tax=Botryococcus braunii TaxID=38881 RepID=A0A0U2F002_BOTBR|nr:ribosomal protein S11 [Botryococcus braunii]AKU37100.1 ribosomal protein S11 [Botryococcus braunii]
MQGSKIWTGKVTRKSFRKGLPAGSGRFSQGGEHKRKRVGMISITATGNNTLFTLSDRKGKLIGSVSAGSVGFRNSGKSALAAAEKGAARIIFKAQEAGFQLLRVEMRGIGYTKLKALRAMVHTPVPILEIVEKTARSHNGCRLPRKRRL